MVVSVGREGPETADCMVGSSDCSCRVPSTVSDDETEPDPAGSKSDCAEGVDAAAFVVLRVLFLLLFLLFFLGFGLLSQFPEGSTLFETSRSPGK